MFWIKFDFTNNQNYGPLHIAYTTQKTQIDQKMMQILMSCKISRKNNKIINLLNFVKYKLFPFRVGNFSLTTACAKIIINKLFFFKFLTIKK